MFLDYKAVVAGKFWRRGERECNCMRKTEANSIYAALGNRNMCCQQAYYKAGAWAGMMVRGKKLKTELEEEAAATAQPDV